MNRITSSPFESVCKGRAVERASFPQHLRPALGQEIHYPEVKPLLTIHTQSPHK